MFWSIRVVLFQSRPSLRFQASSSQVLSIRCRIRGAERHCLANGSIRDLPERIGSGMECKSAVTGMAGEQRIIAQVLMRYDDLGIRLRPGSNHT
jgi:hypothetical protein